MSTSSTDRLRFIPPVAALGTAFVLQVVVITDTVGTAMSKVYPHAGAWPFLASGLLGFAVASCAEGGAAYLMDLYDKHLLARDSVWLLRIAMVGYVAVSGLAIHWWTEQRGLPTIISWLLSGMSASALFLWARGARWRNRQQMVEAGQLDPALPRLPMSAKLLHPVRWATTLFLISWEPVSTTDQARDRYQAWRDKRTGKTARTELYVRSLVDDAQADIATARMAAEAEVSGWRNQAAEQLSAMYANTGQRAAAALSAATEQAALTAWSADSDSEAVRSAAQREADGIRAAAEAAASMQHRRLTDELNAVRLAAKVEAEDVIAAARREADRLVADAEHAMKQAADRLAEAARVQAEADRSARRAQQAADSQPDTSKTVRPDRADQAATTRSDVSVEQLADTLDKRSPDRVPGRPTAITILREVHGRCSGDRAKAAMELLAARRAGREQTSDQSAEQEHLAVTGHINGRVPALSGATP